MNQDDPKQVSSDPTPSGPRPPSFFLDSRTVWPIKKNRGRADRSTLVSRPVLPNIPESHNLFSLHREFDISISFSFLRESCDSIDVNNSKSHTWPFQTPSMKKLFWNKLCVPCCCIFHCTISTSLNYIFQRSMTMLNRAVCH